MTAATRKLPSKNIFRMKDTSIILYLLVAGALGLCANEHRLIHSPNADLVHPMFIGAIEHAEREIEIKVNDKGNLTSIVIDGEIEYFLSEYKFVSQVLIPQSGEAIVLNIAGWRDRSSGVNSQGIIYITPRSNTDWSGPLQIVECLSPEYLQNLDGYRRSVVEVGNAEQFPVVEVKLLYYLSRSSSSKVGYEWIKWNLRKRLPLSKLSPTGWGPIN